MSERCPGCRRSVAATDARCPRCGTSLLGVEIEGGLLPLEGTELVVGRAARPAPRRRVALAAAGGVLALLGGIVLSGRDDATTASNTTTTAGSSTPTTTAAAATSTTAEPITSSGPTEPTTTTTVDVRQVQSEDGSWSAVVTRKDGDGKPVLGVPSGLLLADVSDGQTPRFTDLDTGATVTVSIGVRDVNGGGPFTSPQAFAGGFVVQLFATGGPRLSKMSSLLVYANGEVRSPEHLGGLVDNWYDSWATAVASRTRGWFHDRDDPHVAHLVDLATGTTVRSVTLPAVAVAVAGANDDLVVADPSGRRFLFAPDGSLRPLTMTLDNFGVPVAAKVGRHVETTCDAALSSCTQVYVDDEGTQTVVADADRATSTLAVPAPAGGNLVALVPIEPCVQACGYYTPSSQPHPVPLEVVDLDTGTTAIAGTTDNAGLQGGFGNAGPMWSLDGRWLFFPLSFTGNRFGAWQPGMTAPIEFENPNYSSFNGGATLVFLPKPAAASGPAP